MTLDRVFGSDPSMKQRHLVCYDYGMGGLSALSRSLA
jgi:hypothetical protein